MTQKIIIAILSVILSYYYLTNNSINKFDDLPDLKKYEFVSKQTKLIPGKSQETNPDKIINQEDQLDRIALVSLFYQNYCYIDGRYNHNDFQVESGFLTSNGNSEKYDAYKIYPPKHKATKFLASQHCIYYKFKTKEKYNIFQFEGTKLKKIAEVSATEINTNEFIQIKNLTVSELSKPVIYVFIPARIQISVYKKLAKNIEGAKVKKTKLGNIYKYRYEVFHQVPDFKNSRYIKNRQYFLLKGLNNQINLIWQDQENKSVYLTKFDNKRLSFKNIKLQSYTDVLLIAVTSDNAGNIYYATIKNRDTKKGINETKLKLYKCNSKGMNIISKDINTAKKNGLNIYSFGNYMADMQYLKGKLGFFIARTMHASSDGLNHQGGIAVLFNANTLEKERYFGQTSGHSFDNYLTTSSENKFIGIDLGDNYPRGINLHKFDESRIHSRIVYTFKTEHGKRAKSPAGKVYPPYNEISTSNQKYYKWSNDNGTYTELGAVVECDDSYGVVFAGEPSPTGKSLDCSRAGYNSPDPRNLGYLKVRKDFENVSQKANVVTNDLVLSKGITEKGGFYTFGGWWSEQQNTGVVWLTNYKDRNKENVRNIKAIATQSEDIIIFWEKWSSRNYVNTYALKIDKNGNKKSEILELGEHVRLSRRDDPLYLNDKLYIANGSEIEKKIELIVFDL